MSLLLASLKQLYVFVRALKSSIMAHPGLHAAPFGKQGLIVKGEKHAEHAPTVKSGRGVVFPRGEFCEGPFCVGVFDLQKCRPRGGCLIGDAIYQLLRY